MAWKSMFRGWPVGYDLVAPINLELCAMLEWRGMPSKRFMHVRFSGIDVQRGVFNHRHHVIHDMDSYSDLHRNINILNKEWHGDEKMDEYIIFNSPLTENAVLAFETGYAMCPVDLAVIWEAQHGDYANLAQIVIDECISTMEQKWKRMLGIILLLPHGMNGEGPDESSARPERFLQMVPDDYEKLLDEDQMMGYPGMILACVTTPANYYHIIRRQHRMKVRKPLVIFTPKTYNSPEESKSRIDDFSQDINFQSYIPDPLSRGDENDRRGVTKLILCSGKVYYSFRNKRDQVGLEKEIALSRVEQLHPLPKKKIIEEISRYPSLKEVCWGQEEHKNQGFWRFMKPRLDFILRPFKKKASYVGRGPSAAPATGMWFIHVHEEQSFLTEAMRITEAK